MPISFVASTRSPTSYPAASNNTSDCVITKPTGTVEGDVMVVFLEAGSNATFSYPTGWREVSRYQNTAASMTSGVAYKVVGASETTTYAFADNLADVTPLCGMILTYRGVAIDDPILDPVNAHTESDTGTTGTAAVLAPPATSTADGWYVWYRAGKISTTPPAENSFTISGGTAVLRQASSNRGAGTGYFIAATDSNSVRFAGPNNGATFTRAGSGTFSGSLARTIVLKQATPPTEGTVSVSLGSLTVTTAGSVHDDATMAVQLPGVVEDFAGTHFPPAVGTMGITLGKVTEAFTATSTGGGFTMGLSPVTAAWTGSVNPIGTFSLQLGKITAEAIGETRVFGENVILVESEKRGLKITQDDTIPIYREEVVFQPNRSPFIIGLSPVSIVLTAETTSGEIGISLGRISMVMDGQIIFGDFGLELSPITAGFTGGLVGGQFNFNLPSISLSSSGKHDTVGDFALGLSPIGMNWTDSPAGPFSLTLSPVTMTSAGSIIFGDFAGVQLSPVTLGFAGLSTTEDLLKYAADIGDGTNTSYTVTHSFGSRDVVVAVYDTTTYEEVVPLTTHATTNTVSVTFAVAPATNAYRVVVLYSSV